jgi:hypothetical protein
MKKELQPVDAREVNEIMEETQDRVDPEWMEEKEPEEDFEFELFLSTDGKNTVRVKSNTQKGRKAAMIYAKSVYERLVARYGTKAEQYTKTNGIQTDGKVAPTCGIHGQPMEWKSGNSKATGKPYAFWACNTRNADGSFCNFKPAKA